MIGAAVDVGSNSVHLLVARLVEDGLKYIRDESEQLGLGELVDGRGALPDDAQQLLIHLLETYRDLAARDGAQAVTFLGTEPLRRASNGASVAERVEVETGVRLDILTKREEGELTFLGVTGGRTIDGSLLVVDIGGGSSEVVLFDSVSGLRVTGLATGSNRLTGEMIANDPPTRREIARVREAARSLVGELPDATPERAVFVGGTATNVVKLRPMTTDSFDKLFQDIQSAPAAQLADRFGLRLRRALQLAAGAALTEAILLRYGLRKAGVSDASLRDGAILAAAGRRAPITSSSG